MLHRFTTATLALMIRAAAAAGETCAHGGECPAPERAADGPEKLAAPAETAHQKKHRETAAAVWAKVRATSTLVPGENWPAGLDTEVVFVAVETVWPGLFSSGRWTIVSRLHERVPTR